MEDGPALQLNLSFQLSQIPNREVIQGHVANLLHVKLGPKFTVDGDDLVALCQVAPHRLKSFLNDIDRVSKEMFYFAVDMVNKVDQGADVSYMSLVLMQDFQSDRMGGSLSFRRTPSIGDDPSLPPNTARFSIGYVTGPRDFFKKLMTDPQREFKNWDDSPAEMHEYICTYFESGRQVTKH